MSKTLVVYYSWSNGNTKRIAEKMAEELNADITRIDTAKPYEGSYDDVVSQGQDEVNRGYKPKIKPFDVNIKDYDVIAVGTPTWWYTMAPAVLTFLTESDWSGKKVIPFMTNGGWPGHVIKDMAKECKGAEIVYPMEIQFDSQGGPNLETSESKIDQWIAEIKSSL